ncbi:hypothetical protein TNCV_462241 [Trichonephila clavipes]|uniref:Uncharacterized protein n=1 Tax=Trichonephila clavipes TaxID=2585209 RepID=A0A8X6R700_TRICX|nr:hypothetical protein TNCV_462241 [Trichonephila clavipes]
MKCMHLGEKTGDQPTQRDKPSNLGEKTGDICQLNKTSPPIWPAAFNKLTVSRKSEGFHHGALANVPMHLIVQVVRQGVVIQISEMGQHLQVDGKKSQLFKNFPLVRALDDDEASVSLGQVTKLAPDTESQVFQRHGSGQVAFQAEPFNDVPVGSAVFSCCEEVGVIHRDANYFRIFAIFQNAGNGQFDRNRLTTMVKHVGVGEKGKVRHVVQ